MSDRSFLDTNILIYSYSNSEEAKRDISRKLIEDHFTVISTQVLQELCNVITRKFKLPYDAAIDAVKENSANNIVHSNTADTILFACAIAERYGFSFYDSLIIAAALESGCSILYSEDLNDGQVIDNTLKVVNPFK